MAHVYAHNCVEQLGECRLSDRQQLGAELVGAPQGHGVPSSRTDESQALCGVNEGDGWLRVGDRYLPTEVRRAATTSPLATPPSHLEGL